MDGPIRVLHIEDDEHDAEVFARIAAHAGGFVVRVADRLASGLAALQEFDADIILLDLRLPDTSAPGTPLPEPARLGPLAAILARGSGIPVFILSGEKNPEVQRQALLDGATGYICKDDLVYPDRRGPIMQRLREVAAGSREARQKLREAVNLRHEVGNTLDQFDTQVGRLRDMGSGPSRGGT